MRMPNGAIRAAIPLALALASATPVLAEGASPLSGWSIRLLSTEDSPFYSPFDTLDQNGDVKRQSLAIRTPDGFVAALGVDLTTAPFIRPRLGTDTGRVELTLGKEWVGAKNVYALYGHGGYQNGKVLKALQDAYLETHKWEGINSIRTSPASTDGKYLGGVSGRVDQRLLSDSTRWGTFALDAVGYSTLATDRQIAGAGLSFSLGGGSVFTPDVIGLPATAPVDRHWTPYVTALLEGVAKDIVTERQGTRPVRASFSGGVRYGAFGIGVTTYTNPVKDVERTPNVLFAASLGIKF